ncbi:uncharacterized protein [Labrus bergylta]|uniref:uncharacterized protein isoform X2 n=1 Tax=Labrus bergylta TaxID=56723 RepID=UPI0033134B54
MAKWTLCFALLLPPIVFFGKTAASEKICGRKHNETDAEETLEKTIGTEPDVTALCSNDTEYFISLIICKIRTKRRGRNESCLSYRHEIGFENKCESGVKLLTETQTVFLQLSSLTPEDEGSYTCECSCGDGTFFTHLNVTVEGRLRGQNKDLPVGGSDVRFFLMGVTAVVIITAVIIGFIYRHMRRRKLRQPLNSLQIMEPYDIEPYSTFTRTDCALYSTVNLHGCNINTNNSNTFTREEMHAGKFL